MEHLDSRTLLNILVQKRVAAASLFQAVTLIGREDGLVDGAHEAREASVRAAHAAVEEASKAERILLKRLDAIDRQAASSV